METAASGFAAVAVFTILMCLVVAEPDATRELADALSPAGGGCSPPGVLGLHKSDQAHSNVVEMVLNSSKSEKTADHKKPATAIGS